MGKATGVEARDSERVDASVFIITSFAGKWGCAGIRAPRKRGRGALIGD